MSSDTTAIPTCNSSVSSCTKLNSIKMVCSIQFLGHCHLLSTLFRIKFIDAVNKNNWLVPYLDWFLSLGLVICALLGIVEPTGNSVTSLEQLLKGAEFCRQQLLPTIYISEEGINSRMRGKVGRGADTEDMVTVAVRINNDTLNGIKVIKTFSMLCYELFCEECLTLNNVTLTNNITCDVRPQ